MDIINFNIDSRSRNMTLYPNPGKFVYDLPYTLKNVTSIRLASVELPNLFHTISCHFKNNFFLVNGCKVVLDSGSYTSSKLCDSLNARMTDVRVMIDPVRDRTVFVSEHPFVLSFPKESRYLSLGELLGFRKQLYNGSKAYEGEGGVTLVGENYLLLKVNDYGKVVNTVNDNSYLAKVILSSNKNFLVIDNHANFLCKTHDFLQPVNVSRFCVELCDYLGHTVDMNYVDFSLTLELSYCRTSLLKTDLETNIF